MRIVLEIQSWSDGYDWSVTTDGLTACGDSYTEAGAWRAARRRIRRMLRTAEPDLPADGR